MLYCNGPFCGKSKRLAEELLQAGFTDVRRYQLGAPVWRALGGVMQIEPASFQHVLREDRTAVIFDARTAGEFALRGLPHDARTCPLPLHLAQLPDLLASDLDVPARGSAHAPSRRGGTKIARR